MMGQRLAFTESAPNRSPDRLDSPLMTREVEDVPVVSDHRNDAGDLRV